MPLVRWRGEALVFEHVTWREKDVEVREIRAGIMVYVPPYWIHRSVNTGNTDLVFLFNYPSDAGQDYGIIERNRGMRKRVVTDGSNGWELKDNEDSVKFS